MSVSGQLHASATLPPGKEPPVPIEQEDKWLQSRPGCDGKEKNTRKKLLEGRMCFSGANGSERVDETWNMMKEVVVQDHTEPMRTLRKCGI